MSAITSSLDAVKERQRRMWASGDCAAVAAGIDPMAERPCEAADLVPGARVLDMPTAIAAARRECEVVGIEHVPGLLERARARARAEGLVIDFVEQRGPRGPGARDPRTGDGEDRAVGCRHRRQPVGDEAVPEAQALTCPQRARSADVAPHHRDGSPTPGGGALDRHYGRTGGRRFSQGAGISSKTFGALALDDPQQRCGGDRVLLLSWP
jgi:hypothetical protein